MKTKQALVTLGGTGSRIKNAGVNFQHSKGFINVEGKPICYWNFQNLHTAGVSKLVIICETVDKLNAAQEIIGDLPVRFEEVLYIQNHNKKGSTGLPYHARGVLDESYFFEHGHNLTTPEHYRKMDEARSDGKVVYSIFQPNGITSRPDINNMTVGAPYLLDQQFAYDVADFNFDQYALLTSYLQEGRINTVLSDMPVEFDVIDEYHESIEKYQRFVRETYIPKLAPPLFPRKEY